MPVLTGPDVGNALPAVVLLYSFSEDRQTLTHKQTPLKNYTCFV